jgi:hypothetical protein
MFGCVVKESSSKLGESDLVVVQIECGVDVLQEDVPNDPET